MNYIEVQTADYLSAKENEGLKEVLRYVADSYCFVNNYTRAYTDDEKVKIGIAVINKRCGKYHKRAINRCLRPKTVERNEITVKEWKLHMRKVATFFAKLQQYLNGINASREIRDCLEKVWTDLNYQKDGCPNDNGHISSWPWRNPLDHDRITVKDKRFQDSIRNSVKNITEAADLLNNIRRE